jgi:hypothetical protein
MRGPDPADNPTLASPDAESLPTFREGSHERSNTLFCGSHCQNLGHLGDVTAEAMAERVEQDRTLISCLDRAPFKTLAEAEKRLDKLNAALS